MKNVVYYNELFDCYSSLLTEKEKDIFIDYYNEDLSLSEIASNKKVSRSAIQKTVKTVLDKLDEFECKLHNAKLKKQLINLNIKEVNKILEDI